MLTNAAVKAAGARPRAYKIADAGGLFLFVAPTGLKSFRLKFRYQGKEQLLVLGRFPDISLAEARQARDVSKDQIRRGEDPAAARRRTRSASIVLVSNTFAAIARAWHAQRSIRWSAVHAADVLDSLVRDVFPAIGAKAIADIDEEEVLDLLQAVEARGRIETARRLRQRIAAVFALAKRKKLRPDNPAAELADELAPRPPAQHHAALLEPEQLHALIAAIAQTPAAFILKLAHLFLALTAVRLEALRGARWSEIEDLDGPAPLWRIPAARMKLAKLKKGEAAFDHLVPLSPSAVTVLRAAQVLEDDHIAGAGKLIFPGRDRSRPIGEAAIGALIARAGFKGLHVPHGWRASFSTILNERFPLERDAIDEALGHATKGKVEAAYNRSAQLARRRLVFERWAQLLIAPAAPEDLRP